MVRMAHGCYLYKWSASSNMVERKYQNKPCNFSFLGSFIFIFSLITQFIHALLLLIISCCLKLMIIQIKRGSVEVIILKIFISCYHIKIKCERINFVFQDFYVCFPFSFIPTGLKSFHVRLCIGS